MIHILKPSTLPSSLDFSSSNKEKLTYKRLLEIIEKKSYIEEKIYSSRYKTKDIKEKLEFLYNHKCAYCETKVELSHIDHYRPKSIYYWLVYSWDNLILTCPYCNQYKSNYFNIKQTKVLFNENDLSNIHFLSDKYNVIEKPILIHPEKEDPSKFLIFTKDGYIKSKDDRYKETIQLLKLNRKYLVERRKEIWFSFEKQIYSLRIQYKNDFESFKKFFLYEIKKYKNEFNKVTNDYIAFRKYSLSFIKSLLDEIK